MNLYAHYYPVQREPNYKPRVLMKQLSRGWYLPIHPSWAVWVHRPPVKTQHSTAHLSSHYWWRCCSNGAHWFQINLNNGLTAGILFHYLSLEQGLTWQRMMYSLWHHILHLVNVTSWFINRKLICNNSDNWFITESVLKLRHLLVQAY